MLSRVERGQPITAQWANSVVEAIEYLLRPGGQPPLVVQRQPAGLVVSLGGALPRLDLVELAEDVEAHELNRDADVLAFDETNSGDKWDDGTRICSSLLLAA